MTFMSLSKRRMLFLKTLMTIFISIIYIPVTLVVCKSAFMTDDYKFTQKQQSIE